MIQDSFDRKRKVRPLRAKVKMGGPVTRNGKPFDPGPSKAWKAISVSGAIKRAKTFKKKNYSQAAEKSIRRKMEGRIDSNEG